MRNYFISIFLILPLFTYSQEYVNKIVPTTFGNVNAFNIYKKNSSYLLTGLFGNNMSTIILIDNSINNIEYFYFDSTSFSYKPFSIINDTIYVFSKNRFENKDLKLYILRENFTLNELETIHTAGEYNFPSSSISLDQNKNIYGSYVYDEGLKNKFGIFSINKNGNILWNNTFDENINKSILWRLYSSNTNDLFGYYTVNYNGEFETRARVIKFDTLGNELWKSDTLNRVFNINSKVSMTELSDSNIFLFYEKNMFFDPEYINLNPYPPTFIWLDKNGKIIREDILKMDLDHDLEVSEIKAGTGEYFYVYGTVREFAVEDYGFITKYANNGDTIWTHTYRHPDYNSSNYIYNIKDLIEDDNGDLTVLGAITPIGGKTEVWVFRVNSEGCFGTDSCDQYTLAEHNVPQPDGIKISCYPNPTSGKVMFKGLSDTEDYIIRIYDLQGRLLKNYQDHGPIEVDLSTYVNGMYLIQISGAKFNSTWKVVRQ